MDDLAIAYKEAAMALDYHFYLEDSVVFHDSAWEDRAIPDHDLKLDSETFIRMIHAKDQIGLAHAINGWFDDRPMHLAPGELKRRFNHFTAVVNEALKPLSGNDQEEDQILRKTQAIEASRTYSELRQRLKQWATAWIGRLEAIEQDKNSLIIKRCKEYLDKHYMEELSLEKIAAMFHFNPSYFSNLFKQKTGANLTDYIINLRIEHAKHIIAASDAKVADVSREVGFRNTAYFIKMFKRRTGLSPNRYRQIAGREH
jgi:two-component system response regulator YesN